MRRSGISNVKMRYIPRGARMRRVNYYVNPMRSRYFGQLVQFRRVQRKLESRGAYDFLTTGVIYVIHVYALR
jgi:hypothetical protein